MTDESNPDDTTEDTDDFVPKQVDSDETTAGDEIQIDESAAVSEKPGTDIPPASFEVLLSMMFTQGMAMLGQIPDPNTGQAKVDKGVAKHTIDTLVMLGEKTEGNLTDDEAKMLGEALHALRMAFVSTQG